ERSPPRAPSAACAAGRDRRDGRALRELAGEERERGLRLRRRVGREVEAEALEVRARLDRDLEGLGWQALRRELEHGGAVRKEPELGDDPALERRRRERELQDEDRAERSQLVRPDALRRVLGEERALLLREQLPQRPRPGDDLEHLVVRGLALHRRRA